MKLDIENIKEMFNVIVTIDGGCGPCISSFLDKLCDKFELDKKELIISWNARYTYPRLEVCNNTIEERF